MVVSADYDRVDVRIGEEGAIIRVSGRRRRIARRRWPRSQREISQSATARKAGMFVDIGQVHELRDLAATNDANADDGVSHFNL